MIRVSILRAISDQSLSIGRQFFVAVRWLLFAQEVSADKNDHEEYGKRCISCIFRDAVP
jgi:hypothetical protein